MKTLDFIACLFIVSTINCAYAFVVLASTPRLGSIAFRPKVDMPSFSASPTKKYAGCFTNLVTRSAMEFPQSYFTVLDELLLRDVSKQSFHNCWADLYTEASSSNILMTNQFPRRIVGKFPLKIGKKRLWTPMLIDTGAPSCLISTETLNHFKTEIVSPLPIHIGHLSTRAHVISDDEAKLHSRFADINILGMDVLEKIFPTWPDSLGEQLTSGLRLTAQDLEECDAFAALSDEDPIAKVFDLIAAVQGPKYTDTMKVTHIRVLKDYGIFSVGMLRKMPASAVRSLPLWNAIQEVLCGMLKL